MCKYCKMKTINESLGERTNDMRVIGVIKDGRQIFDAHLHRYKTNNSEGFNYLVLELDIDYGGYTQDLVIKEIPIKFCPFCGEEL